MFDVFNVFIDTHIDEVLFWNPDVAYYDGVFTQTDLIRIILKCYENISKGIPNGKYFRNFSQFGEILKFKSSQ